MDEIMNVSLLMLLGKTRNWKDLGLLSTNFNNLINTEIAGKVTFPCIGTKWNGCKRYYHICKKNSEIRVQIYWKTWVI